MRKQEIFDTVVRHLAKQGKPAVNEFNKCVYRQEDGTMCAVGCLIPEDKYSSDFEYNDAGDVIPMLDMPGLLRNREMLVDLQHIHDSKRHWNDGNWPSAFRIPELKNALMTVARDHGVNMKAIREAFPAE